VKGAVIALLLILPTSACAESPASQGFSFFSSLIQMVAALSLVIGLILLTRHFAAKLGGGAAPRLASKHIRVLETRYLSPKKSLVLIEVGGEYLLLASTDDGISLIRQVNVIEEIEVLEEAGEGRSGVRDWLRRSAMKRKG
jgi:flagellar protein FliO/FliZ